MRGRLPLLLLVALVACASGCDAFRSSAENSVAVDLGTFEGPPGQLPHSNEEDCSNIGSHDDPCAFFREHCGNLDAAKPFLNMYYCSLAGHSFVAISLLTVAMVVLFAVFATTASQFFVPNINGITTTLGISETVAGVTFAAFGNGAPDIFSSLAAFANSESGGLAFGELLGAAMFILTVVMGAVAFICPFSVSRFPLFRDVAFFVGALVIILAMLADKSVTLAESIVLVVYYFIYVSVVVFSHALPNVFKRFESRVHLVENPILGETGLASPTEGPRLGHSGTWWSSPQILADGANEPVPPATAEMSTAMDLQRSLIRPSLGMAGYVSSLPIVADSVALAEDGDTSEYPSLGVSHKTVDLLFPWARNFASLSLFRKAIGIVSSPVWVALRLTVPVVDQATMDSAGLADPWSDGGHLAVNEDQHPIAEDDDVAALPSSPSDGRPLVWRMVTRGPLRWHRWLSAINVLLFPSIVTFGISGLGASVGSSNLPAGVLSALLGLLASAAFVAVTRNDRPPRWYGLLAFVGFSAGILWIYLIANQLVGLLQTMGLIFGVSEALMGLTIFAWGNSMGDLMTDISLAKMGYAELAMGACYGSPMLNIVLGVGLGGLVSTFKTGSRQIEVGASLWASALGLLAALLTLLTMIPLQGYRTTRATGIVLICVYAVYLVIQLSLSKL
ncbi:Sodium/calcium exchanger protein-domain-containing protein [Hyaloraphidium curvatum]|nr:Sodium/calcium exchanger protein-domain-containing protein [Hyaloraphidium curvatum]